MMTMKNENVTKIIISERIINLNIELFNRYFSCQTYIMTNWKYFNIIIKLPFIGDSRFSDVGIMNFLSVHFCILMVSLGFISIQLKLYALIANKHVLSPSLAFCFLLLHHPLSSQHIFYLDFGSFVFQYSDLSLARKFNPSLSS